MGVITVFACNVYTPYLKGFGDDCQALLVNFLAAKLEALDVDLIKA